MTIRELPAPVILAPISSRQSATSVISGSHAAFSITVVPRAREAAISSVWVPPTVTLGKIDLAADEATLGAGDDVPSIDLDLGAEFSSAMINRSTGRVPMAQPPGIDTFASPMRATSSATNDPEARAHARDQFVGRGGVDDVGSGRCRRLAVVLGFTGRCRRTMTSTPWLPRMR